MALSVGGLLLPVSMAHAAIKPRVTDVRFSSTPNRTRIVFALNHEVKHTLSLQKEPQRVVLDLADTELTNDLNLLSFSDGVVRKIRTSALSNGTMRATFELN
ncbi:MAG: AMIN domain-containing protein, partial [Magnetococcales bacterium]|nr:AMIN domain-containing protein [Magnetococcales bacterium]